jgi:hypothetical protein
MRFLVKISLYAIFGQKWGKYMHFLSKIRPKVVARPFFNRAGRQNFNKKQKRTPSVKLSVLLYMQNSVKISRPQYRIRCTVQSHQGTSADRA